MNELPYHGVRNTPSSELELISAPINPPSQDATGTFETHLHLQAERVCCRVKVKIPHAIELKSDE